VRSAKGERQKTPREGRPGDQVKVNRGRREGVGGTRMNHTVPNNEEKKLLTEEKSTGLRCEEGKKTSAWRAFVPCDVV